MRFNFYAVLCAAFFPLSTAFAAEKDANKHVYMSQLHAINIGEQKIGDMAIKRGQHPEIKDFGKMLMDDHEKSDAKIIALAKRKNILLETAQFNAETAKLDKVFETLRNTPVNSFDHVFANKMFDGHKQATEMVAAALSKEKDEDLKSFLREQMNVLKEHQQMAEKLSKKGSNLGS